MSAARAELTRHYTIDEIAKAWGVSPATVRRLFCNEPGVVALSVDVRPGKRQYVTLRVPAEVLATVYQRNRKVIP